MTFYAFINQEISPHVFLRKRNKSFYSNSLKVTHRRNREIQKVQRNKQNEELEIKIRVGSEFTHHRLNISNKNHAKMLLQEALMSRLKIRQNYETPTAKIVAAKAYEKSRKGQLALLGKLPDFTIDDTKSKLAFSHQSP